MDGKISASTIYLNVFKNRGNLLDKLIEINGLSEINDSIHSEDFSNTDISSHTFDNTSDTDDYNKLKFKIVLTFDDFRLLKPESKSYRRGNYTKTYKTLKPNHWTSFFYAKIWNETKLACNYVFKKCTIGNNNSLHYFTFMGWCTDCHAKINGWSDSKPSEDNEIWEVNISVDRPNKSKRLHTTKRQCRGIERSEIGQKLLHNLPSNWQREKVNEICKFGDKIPPHIYNSSVLRQVKNEYKIKKLGIKETCPIQSLDMLKQTTQNGSIHTLSINEFFVHYWSPFQLAIYKSAHKRGHCKLTIDATGSLVYKIKRLTADSHHIFLYEIVLYGHGIQVSIGQMLSEKQDMATIQYWLQKWLMSGIPVPKEVRFVTMYTSYALI